MSSDVVIRVENVSKCYRLGTIGTGTLSGDISHLWNRVLGKDIATQKIGAEKKQTDGDSNIFWALKDISFEVKRGEVLGIIGRNGAGKSTLLKILSHITQPTSGEIKIKGKIASLLEVGTGFHPELSGRENIFLNGAILGMRKNEIKKKFDEIVDFSGVEKFIDTPVKRYSSGMYVRLAFAVAAHLEPEILIVDEVLAVGDAEFQKKCLGKMKDVSGQGRTVIFVSHNMLAIKSLCSIGMYLSSGKILQSGKINEVIERYLEEERSISRVSLIDRSDRVGNGVIKFDEVTFYNREGMEVSEVPSGDDLTIKLKYKSILPGVNNAEVAIAFNNNLGIQIAMISNTVLDKTNKELGESGYFVFKIPNIPFVSGTYSMNLFCRVNNEITDWIVNTAALSITVGDYYKTGKNSDKEQSIFLLNFDYDSES